MFQPLLFYLSTNYQIQLLCAVCWSARCGVVSLFCSLTAGDSQPKRGERGGQWQPSRAGVILSCCACYELHVLSDVEERKCVA